MLSPFTIRILHDRLYHYIYVVPILNDGTTEQYQLVSKKRTITLQSNRPYLRRLGLKHKRPNWHVVEGRINLPGLLETFIDELMKVIDSG